jgi:hypothetical protein
MRSPNPWYKRTPVIVALIPVVGAVVLGLVKVAPLLLNQHKSESFIGKVSDKKGTTRIQGAKVSLEGKGLPPVLYTDSEGVFKFEVPEGVEEIKIVVEADGFARFDRRLRVSAKKEIEEIHLDVLTDAKANLSGTVVDSHDQPLQGAQVTLDDIPGMAAVQTSSDGVFNINEIPKKYGEGVRVRVVLLGYQPNPYTEDVVLGKAPPIIKLRKK